MNKRKLFGTDGIRGVANSHPMTSEVALKLGRALTSTLQTKGERPKVIIGKDTRLSCYMLETALTSGVVSMGGTALLLGPLPTPSVAYLIRSMRAQGGVMISASHNPYHDNGLKVFGADGFKLDDQLEADLERLMDSEEEVTSLRPSPERLGRARRLDDAQGRYLSHLKTIFRHDFDLVGKRIVFDGANGAAYDVGPKLFQELGAEVFVNACEPNGTNINEKCAQVNPDLLCELVKKNNADIGIAVDGDADRLIVVDETGKVIAAEHLLYHWALFLREGNRLPANTVVTTTMTNESMVVALKQMGIETLRTQVGDRYVVEAMRKGGFVLGGENSGHTIFLDQNTTADGLFSALEILALLHRKKWKASELRRSFALYPQKLVSVRVKERVPLETRPKLWKAIQDLEKSYEGAGRVNIRYSGTEPVLRLMLEGPRAEQIEIDLQNLAAMAQAELT